MNKTCLKCNLDIRGSHFNRKYCHKCAKYLAIESSRLSISRWKSRNKDKVKSMNREWSTKFPLKKRLTHAKDIAKRRGFKCDITNEQFISYWNSKCEYCYKAILNEKGIGLDRLDNNLGYTPENVVPCCGDCNYIKGDILTHAEMKIAMNAVLEFRRSNG